ncbi:hypothetical protein ACQ4PT_063764 [Festuca glaucescens]
MRTDAAARLGELRDQILSGRGSFIDLEQHSDCSSARRGGDLGTHAPARAPFLRDVGIDLDLAARICRVARSDPASRVLILLYASVPLLIDSFRTQFQFPKHLNSLLLSDAADS